MKIIAIQFMAICFTFNLSNAADSCRTPENKNGNCIPITNCSSLYERLEIRPLTNINVDYLRQSHCGFEGIVPRVCCPLELNSESGISLLPLDDCGMSTQNKIVGGEKTELDEFPWMVLLQYERYKNFSIHKKFRCGGVLISKRYVLTAAHCTHEKLLSSEGWNLKRVRLGEYNTETDPDCIDIADCAPSPVDVDIFQAIVHENYNIDQQYNDIALLRLEQEIKFSEFIKPICLPIKKEDMGKDYVGENLFVAGWGKTENMSMSSTKLKVQVPVVDFSDCKSKYNFFGKKLIREQMCAGGKRGKDSCNGDSGGPLMTVKINKRKNSQWYAVGLLSQGVECGMPNWPAIYTRTEDYVNWILNNLKP